MLLSSKDPLSVLKAFINENGDYSKSYNVTIPNMTSCPKWNFGLVMADFNGDGFLDLASADAFLGTNIFINDKQGCLKFSENLYNDKVVESKGICVGDLDNDGDIDIVVSGHSSKESDSVYINNGEGKFYLSQTLKSETTWDVSLGDLDKDGDLDLVRASRYFWPIEIYFNDGKCNFTKRSETLELFNTFDVKLADFNFDGYLDIVVAAHVDQNSRSKVYLNDGNGHFKDSGQVINQKYSAPSEVSVSDINNDGYNDIILCSYSM